MHANSEMVFAPFRLDLVKQQIWRGDDEIRLRRKTFEVLRYLVRHPGELVTKEALLDAVWPDVAVSDTMPSVSVAELRKALGDENKAARFIETVHGRGYRFIAEVTAADATADPSIDSPTLRTHHPVGTGANNAAATIPFQAGSQSVTAAGATPLRIGFLPRTIFSAIGLAMIIAAVVVVQQLSLKPPRGVASITRSKPRLPLPTMPSIAVLAFSNLSGDPEQDYFSDAVSDRFIAQLSRSPRLFVIGHNSSVAYKDSALGDREIGEQLGVKYLLKGSVLKSGERFRVSVKLIDAAHGTEMWGETYDRPLNELFAVPNEILDKMVMILRLSSSPHDLEEWKTAPWRQPENPEAFDDILQAMALTWRGGSSENIAAARQWAEKAIRADPNFAEAYAFLGWTYCNDAMRFEPQNHQADLERATAMAQKALALDDTNWTAWTLMTRADYMQRRFDQAIAAGRRAVAAYPGSVEAHTALAEALMAGGNPEEALRVLDQAIRLDPLGRYGAWSGAAYVIMGRYTEAIPRLKEALAANPNAVLTLAQLVVAEEELGRDAEARADAAQLMRTNPRFVVGNPEDSLVRDVSLARRFKSDLRKAGLH